MHVFFTKLSAESMTFLGQAFVRKDPGNRDWLKVQRGASPGSTVKHVQRLTRSRAGQEPAREASIILTAVALQTVSAVRQPTAQSVIWGLFECHLSGFGLRALLSRVLADVHLKNPVCLVWADRSPLRLRIAASDHKAWLMETSVSKMAKPELQSVPVAVTLPAKSLSGELSPSSVASAGRSPSSARCSL